MSVVQSFYATEEDVALRAPADYAALLELEPPLATGPDGGFLAGSRWTLRSTLVDFEAQGVRPGHLVRVRQAANGSSYPGELLIVVSVAGGAMELRRPGEPARVGQPPGPPGGATGVEFLVADLGPRLERASREVAGRLGLLWADGSIGHDAGSIVRLRDLTVAELLRATYQAAVSQASGDLMTARAEQFRVEVEDRLARMVAMGRAGSERVSRSGTRLSR